MADYKKIDLQIGTEEQFEEKKLSLPVGTLVGITDPIHESELDTDLKNEINGKYTKPSGGIPKTDLASAVQTSLGKADSAIQKPSTPTTESAITINSSGTVSTKPLTSITGKTEVYVGSTTPTNPDEILWIDPNGTSGGGGSGGGKLYKHIITVSGTKSNGAPYGGVWSIIDNHNKTYTFQDIIGKYYPFTGGMPILVYSDDPATPHFLAALTALYQIVVGTTVDSNFGTATNFKDTVTEL